MISECVFSIELEADADYKRIITYGSCYLSVILCEYNNIQDI